MKRRVAIIAAKRTPIGKFLGAFRNTTAVELGTSVVRGVLDASAIEAGDVDEVIFGNARQAGVKPNPARQIAFAADIPKEVPAYTVNMACASGIKSITLGADAITLGRASCVVAGGAENMTRVPFLLDRARLGYRLGHAPLTDGMYQDGFGCPLSGMLMGETAEVLADEFGIPREEQDGWALISQHRAEAARRDGVFAQEILPVTAADDRGRPVEVTEDEHPRSGVTMEALAKLPPVFRRDGSVTAGNASGITDAAAAVVLTSEDRAKAWGKKPLGYIRDHTVVGVDPERMGIGPVPATKRILERNDLRLEDIALIELNEAFAVQVLACQRALGFDKEKVNVRGGAISLGHPIGATGTRIVVTLLHEMNRRGAELGLATLCVSGGLGMALLVERN
ncbi:MAG: thiolase family protein [Candidatus Krumholzibacteria bacterium]|nr:thiolase family protein [Candidatus Krumholzibacteria bacterium]